MYLEHWWNETSQQDCPLCHSYSMYSDIINKRSRMSKTIYNGWILSAKVIVHGNMEKFEEKDLWPVRVQCFLCSTLAEDSDRINWERDGDVDAREEQHSAPLPIGSLPGHTVVTKSYGFKTDARGGLISEWWLTGAKCPPFQITAFLGETGLAGRKPFSR